MDKNLNQDNFIRDITIEEFDHITDGVEDHVFSDEYLARKESIMKNTNKAPNVVQIKMRGIPISG